MTLSIIFACCQGCAFGRKRFYFATILLECRPYHLKKWNLIHQRSTEWTSIESRRKGMALLRGQFDILNRIPAFSPSFPKDTDAHLISFPIHNGCFPVSCWIMVDIPGHRCSLGAEDAGTRLFAILDRAPWWSLVVRVCPKLGSKRW